MKRLFTDRRKHSTETINFEKKKMIRLNKETRKKYKKQKLCQVYNPVDTGCKLNVHKTSWTSYVRLIYVLYRLGNKNSQLISLKRNDDYRNTWNLIKTNKPRRIQNPVEHLRWSLKLYLRCSTWFGIWHWKPQKYFSCTTKIGPARTSSKPDLIVMSTFHISLTNFSK